MIGGAETGQGTVELLVDEVDGAGLGEAGFVIEGDDLFGDGGDEGGLLSVQQVGGDSTRG